MWFLKILLLLLLFEEYQCEDIHSINATHCEYSKRSQVHGKRIPQNVTRLITYTKDKNTIGTRIEVRTLMKPAFETIKKIKCCRGYKSGPRKTCIPKCDQFCENADCTAPNEWTCKKGFKKLSPIRCIPHCESCDMGRCIGPDICVCHNGYHKNETGQCEPTCEKTCENGWCSEPGVCSCNPGYELDKTDKYKCNPNCTTPCIQGRCTAPDVCDCHPGYEFKNGSKNECLPICDFCESGGNCTGSTKCTCWDSYEQEIVQGTDIVKRCKPRCMDECINGDCIEVDTCYCKKGYEFVKDSYNVCEPVCDPPCNNGDCIAPNVCECDDGYELIDGECQAQCDDECINGFCVYPNQCECNDGYVFTIGSENLCEAFCENCTNGICVEPNVCECLAGFRMTERNVCEKLCVPECISGKCVDGICFCDNGFQLYNGICVVITTTESEDLFVTTTELPEVFSTSSNFEMEETEGISTTEYVQCLCENGQCEEVNNCVCGIDKDGCINGTCVSPGICKCFDGFELHPSNPYECVLEKIAAIESAPVQAFVTNSVSLILLLLIVALTSATLILWLSCRNRKVNYNVDEKERKVGVHGEDYVHYITNKDDNAFA